MKRRKLFESCLSVILSVFLIWGVGYALNLSRAKTWTSEVLTHTDLNAEFDNVLNHTLTNADCTASTDWGAFSTSAASVFDIDSDAVDEAHLKAVDSANDEDVLTYEATTGDFEWHTVDQLLTATAPVTVAQGGTGVTASTGTVAVVLSTSPTLITPALGTPSALVGTNISGTGASFTAGSVTNATLTTALTVDTGTVGLTGNGANTSVLTLGAGASSISGANTGDNSGTDDQTLAEVLASAADANDLDITSMDKLEGVDPQVYIDLGGDGIVEIEADTAVSINSEVRLENISGNTFWVGPNCTYTTIDSALNAVAAGDTILVSEGTYSEAITFDDDNITVKAIGSKANTIITQVATRVVNFFSRSGCVLDGFTANVTSADGNIDQVIYSSNDDASDFNYVINCDLNWTSSVALNYPYPVHILNGNFEFRNCNIVVTSTYAGTDPASLPAIELPGAGHSFNFIHSTLTHSNAATGDADWIGGIRANQAVTTLIQDSTIDVDSAAITTANIFGVHYQTAASTVTLRNNLITVDCSDTGLTWAIKPNITGSVFNSYNNVYSATNTDGDQEWANVISGATLNSYGDKILDGVLTNAGTANIYNEIDEDGRVISEEGFVIAETYDSTYHFDTSTQGSDAGTVYIGNDTIAFSFTGKHFYQLGDTDLVAGELVSLKSGKAYRTKTQQDKDAIGIYWGITNTKDSLGNILVVDKVGEVKNWDEKDKIWKKKDVKKVNKYGKKNKPKQEADIGDFSRAVATIGDSMETHDAFPLSGAWVCIDNGIIKSGDYLQASDKDGYLEKQLDDIMHSYTVGQAREDIPTDTQTGYIYLLQ